MRTLTGPLGGALAVLCAATIAGQGPAGVTRSIERFTMRVIATGLAAPWEVTYGPDQQLWVTEREGKRVVRINPADGSKTVVLTVPDVHQSIIQDGLLGLALHPDLQRGAGSDFVYVSLTYDDAPGPEVVSRLAIRRYRYDQSTRTLVDPTDVLKGLPAHSDHVGGRLIIGPDRMLFLTIGDQGSNWAQNRCNPNRAQDLPTESGRSRKKLVGLCRQSPAPEHRRLDSLRQSHHRRSAQPRVLLRSSQPARPRPRPGREAVRVRARA